MAAGASSGRKKTDLSCCAVGFTKAPPICSKVHGAQIGDTCFSVAKAFNLTTEDFNAINPNLNCIRIFVGEWLCVNGLAN
ncbi:hypothetical protein RJ639_023674 [Escallonia herrerae]|uniref:LysM domain-containing protein n=1 Tax=Escallonia herrerae TaxID=1293975 RepID=A0AA88V0X4_9ASTE|nr:hypothetical protein RJ639_023674 [Escallonia herrerae]